MSGKRTTGMVLAAGVAAVLVAGGTVAVEQLRPAAEIAASVRPSPPLADPDSEGNPTSEPTAIPTTTLAVPVKTPTPHPVGPPKTTAKPTAKTTAPVKKTTTTVTGGMTALEGRVLALTNTQRAANGCGPLRGDSRLANAARAHSDDMAANKYFEHNSQDGSTPWDRIKRAGYSQPGAENIAMGYPTADAVMEGWMNSPGHRANILNCKLVALGVGVHSGGTGGPWWTQDFGFI
jgi:Uncharacterized protein with SCP/PR1 domains